MKPVIRLTLIVMMLAILLAPAPQALAATKTTCAYWYESMETIDPGTIEVLPSGNVHIRDMVIRIRDGAECPYVIGVGRVVMNANLDKTMSGPAWGTSHFVSDEGGAWDLVWKGTMVNNVPISLHGHAVGSLKYEGMNAQFSEGPEGNTITVLIP